MAFGLGMLPGVAIRRAIAAPRGAARLAGAEVHPAGAGLHARFALHSPWAFDVIQIDGPQVLTAGFHRGIALTIVRQIATLHGFTHF